MATILDVGQYITELLPGVDKHSDEATQHSNNRVLSAQAHDIVDIHHSYCWLEMPELQELVHKVARVHGDAHPEPNTPPGRA